MCLLTRFFKEFCAFDQTQTRERRGRPQRVRRVTVAMKKSTVLFQRAQEAAVNFFGCHGRRQRSCSAGERLSETKKIRRDVFQFTSKKPAGARKTGRDFIGDHQRVMFFGETAETRHISSW